ncbi:adenosylcobinamide-phosphate synthase CbiB [Sulfurimonas sp.]|uniref:adenosylcobinamide-phosphate synthase CbiB n=1 Tax=Sulfurimonas sp. TaxID=2022749 RepID=UPI003567E4C5
MINITIAIFAYLIDRKFGEFRSIKHPVIIFGEMIEFFEKHFYKDSVSRGALLVIFMLCVVGTIAILIQLYIESLGWFLNILITSVLASIFVAHNMLIESVKNVLSAEDKKQAISMLVSRDTEHMSESDIYKASIETYAENLSDGVIAPLFYLLFFGLFGIVIYKVINTMDSMVGYKNEIYINFGKVAARLDDLVNYIPARITAVLIMLSSYDAREKYGTLGFYKDGEKHESPNAGHPITAMALVLEVKLGGDTYYFGKLKHKPYFGEGRENITKEDVQNALQILV